MRPLEDLDLNTMPFSDDEIAVILVTAKSEIKKHPWIKRLLATVLEKHKKIKALGQWKCEECGCRFEKIVRKEDLIGVRRCSNCAAIEGMRHRIDHLSASQYTCPVCKNHTVCMSCGFNGEED